MNTDALLKQAGVVPVIRLEEEGHAVPLARALLAGGVGVAEITFRTKAAAGAIQAVAEHCPEMFVCAGTVLTVEQAELAVSCGAGAIVSPGTNPKVVAWCLQHEVPIYPGCATPTEIEAALALGLTAVKLFPAEVIGGVKLLKALSGPYGQMKFMPTGGVSPGNVKDYLTLPNVLACGGSWLCPESALTAGDWNAVTKLAAECTALVRSVRGEE